MRPSARLSALAFALVVALPSLAGPAGATPMFKGLGPTTTASGISSDGTVVVGTTGGGRDAEAFRWTASGGKIGLGQLGTVATAACANGSVLVGNLRTLSGADALQAFRWTPAGGTVGLGQLPNGTGSV